MMNRMPLGVGWGDALDEPIQTATKKRDHLIEWLNSIEWQDGAGLTFQRLQDCAHHFHPGLDGPGTDAVLMLERGETDKSILERSSPFMANLLPKRLRGDSHELKFAKLVLFAMLTAYECEELFEAQQKGLPISRAFEHLYWFERFFGVWAREAATPPPKRWFQQKQSASDWRGDVERFSIDYFKENPEKAATNCADAYMRKYSGDRTKKGEAPVTWDLVSRHIQRTRKKVNSTK